MQRYQEVVNVIKTDGKRRYETIYYPNFENKSTDIYIMAKQLERMDLLAFQYYRDPRLWWVIQRANGLPGGTLVIPAGRRIRIPNPLTEFDVIALSRDNQF